MKKGLKLWNFYGPTETTIWSSLRQVTNSEDSVFIGKPIYNTQFYVVDSELRPVPVGVPGELLIGGDGLAKGYWHRDELTAEKFIKDPYSYKPGARLYKTGDLVKYHSCGEIEFLGRLDFQVKIRGFRIELGDIEYALLEREDIAQCVVMAREDQSGDKYLAAYIIPQQEMDVAIINTWREYLGAKLPYYMIPTSWMIMDEFPLTPNQKVNRKALPEPNLSSAETELLPIENNLQEVLSLIWKDVLHVEEIGRNSNFFDLGGHSLKATQIHARVKKIFKSTVSLRDFFQNPTLEGLAVQLTTLEPKPGIFEKVATAYLRMLNMTPEEREQYRARQKSA